MRRTGWMGLVAACGLAACGGSSGDAPSGSPDAAIGGATGGAGFGGETPAGGVTGGAGFGGETPAGGTTGGAPAGGAGFGGETPVGGEPGLAPWPVDDDTPWTPTTPAGVSGEVAGVPESGPPDCADTFVGAVRGWVAAPGGAPVEGAKAQLCIHLSPSDSLLCLQPGTTGADGVFTINVPEQNRCITRSAMRVLLPDAGKATTYCPVPVEGAPSVIRRDSPFVLFQTKRPITLPPEGDGAAREVVFDDGLVVEFTPSQWYSGGGVYDELGARRVPVDSVGLCLPEDAAPFAGLYAFYPEGAADEGVAFPVHLPNVDGFAPGSQVELSVLGGLDCKLTDGTAIPEATWAVVGTATVSPDGARIDSDPGVGLPCTTWLGYRPL